MRGGAGAELGLGMRGSGCGARDGDAGLRLRMRGSGCGARAHTLPALRGAGRRWIEGVLGRFQPL